MMFARIATAAFLIALAPLPAPAAGGLDTVQLYAGTWKTHIDHLTTKFSKARSEDTTVKNDCWRSDDFYVCHQIVDGKSSDIIVYSYDAKANQYHSHGLAAGADAQMFSGTFTINGNEWIYPWQDKDGTQTVYVRIVNTFEGRDTIHYRQEFSYDNVHWTVTATGTEHRVG